jgi:predicted kinase
MTDGPIDALSGAVTQRIARDIQNQIEAGVLRDGEVMPSTRVLAEQVGASVWSVTEAMKALAEMGLVENQARSRRIVRSAHLTPKTVKVSPRALLIGGYAGSGKTELGRILTRLTGWMIIDKDTTTRPVVEVALEALGSVSSDRESETYLSKVRPREYEALMSTAHENTSCGVGAVITAPFIREFSDASWLAREQDRFAVDGLPMTVVWIDCDADTMLTYVRRRGAARDAHKLATWDKYIDGIDLDFRPSVDHHVIDNSQSAGPLRGQAEKLLATLAERETL